MHPNYNGGRPRYNSIEPERIKSWKRLLTYDEKDLLVRTHPETTPKDGKPNKKLSIKS